MGRGNRWQGETYVRTRWRQTLVGLISLLVVVSFATVGVGTVVGASSTNTLYVDDSRNCPGEPCYVSIQYAVDNATSDHTVIHVEPGTYKESITLDVSNTTIVGAEGDDAAGAGSDAPVLDGEGSSAFAFTISPSASNVSVRGVEIREYTQMAFFVNNQQSVVTDGITVTDTSISGTPFGFVTFARDSGSEVRNITVSRNDIVPAGKKGVLVVGRHNGTISDVTVSDNRIHDGTGVGIETYSWENQSLVENVDISGNTITNLTGEGVNVNTEDASATRTVTVERNVLRESDNGTRIQHSDSAVVETVKVRYNDITSNDHGVYVENGIDNAEVTLTHNTISGNANSGVTNDDGSILNADQNWWGDGSGPYHPSANPSGQGDTVSDNVDFEPWYTRTVELSNGTAQPGDTVTVTLRADAADVAGFQTNLTFDESVAQVQSVSSGDLGSPTANVDNGSGWVALTSSQATGVNTPVLATVTFEITGDPGDESSITISQSETALFDQGGDEIGSTTLADGTVGAYANGSGDVNGDGNVDAGDVVLVQRYIVGQDVDIDTEAADVNGDGTVDASDALLIEQQIVGT